MPSTIYVLLTWTTRERDPVIDAECGRFLRRFLPAAASRHGARAMEIGIVSDHVHVLLMLPPLIDIPRLVQGLKGASARIANRDGIVRKGRLRWASGYDLRSISPTALERVAQYLRNQGGRHPQERIDG